MIRSNHPSGVLPSWKNSPIKTFPNDLRRITVPSQKPPTHKLPRVLLAGTQHDSSKMLRDVSSMFDDDGDHVQESVVDDLPTPSIADEDAMRAMFASPNQSMNNSFNATKPSAEYYWDREEVLDDDGNVQSGSEFDPAGDEEPPAATTYSESVDILHGTSPDLQAALKAAAQFAFEYTQKDVEPVDLQKELRRNSFLLEHIQFLAGFDAEMTAHISNAQPANSTLPDSQARIDHERELIAKLDHYLKLPQESLHAMVMRQHQEIIEMGIFGTD